ncbi:hypothetical protein DEV91_104282 [Phyllobacterium brassicacearum]|nr:hypothetical protein DEV91_104282 [Phyllobacterium brassicacearum]
MMSGIRGTNTKPELLLRKGLHARGVDFMRCQKAAGKAVRFPRTSRLPSKRFEGASVMLQARYAALGFVAATVDQFFAAAAAL